MSILIIKNISTSKYTIEKIKTHTDYEKICAKNVFDKGLVSKEFSITHKTNNPTKKNKQKSFIKERQNKWHKKHMKKQLT